GGYR
ncbi:hypothetical protein ACTA71_006777, partial [Dictyostelium dimigraforme]